MASKYDRYWQANLNALASLLREAYERGSSRTHDVSGIQQYGNRGSWYGVVELFPSGIRKGDMAHAHALGVVVQNHNLLVPFKNTAFRLTVSNDLKLRAVRIDTDVAPDSILSRPASPSTTSRQRTSPTATAHGTEELSAILSDIPWQAWQAIVSNEPEWKLMVSFLPRYGFGPFSALMVATGRNDYQLMGRAETAYWPPLRRLIEAHDIPRSPQALGQILEPFYERERLSTQKVRRLHRFLNSALARRLWEVEPQIISDNFPTIWRLLAQVMGQEPEAKTISFAMKCLGMSLLMANVSTFDFTAIPIPVDVRVIAFTRKAGLGSSDHSEAVQDVWHNVLAALQQHHAQLTMIHLDSLVWQIAPLDAKGLQAYFTAFGIPRIGERLAALVSGQPMPHESSEQGHIATSVAPPQARAISAPRRLILFPCSGRKRRQDVPRNTASPQPPTIFQRLQDTSAHLRRGRDQLSHCMNLDSSPVRAIDRYNGTLYEVDHFRDAVCRAYARNDVDVLIMSGAYGIVLPDEMTHYYEQYMDARYWTDHNLPAVIEEDIARNHITHIYGFFSRTTDYLQIMQAVNWANLRRSSELAKARTYYVRFQGTGGAQVIVPQVTGKLIVSFIKSDFSEDTFYENPFFGQRIEYIDHLATS